MSLDGGEAGTFLPMFDFANTPFLWKTHPIRPLDAHQIQRDVVLPETPVPRQIKGLPLYVSGLP